MRRKRRGREESTDLIILVVRGSREHGKIDDTNFLGRRESVSVHRFEKFQEANHSLTMCCLMEGLQFVYT